MTRRAFSLFERYGIELEYMIVDRKSGEVRSLTDELLRAAAGCYVNEFASGEVTWSNELVVHVFELKVTEPVPRLDGIASRFHKSVTEINQRLSAWGACLMPGAAHPWMDPARDAKIWPHEYAEIYQQYDRIFGCRTHGWTNLQSQHINLPFRNNEEFGRLHAAIRLLLPLLPGLAAASPYLEGKRAGAMDARLEAYRVNARKIPSITGRVIPEPAFTAAAYRRDILEPMYLDTAPYDPEGNLLYEWLNSRGAIARFDRKAIEIRLLDMQECPQADLAIAWAVVHTLKALVSERWSSLKAQKAWGVEPLDRILMGCVRDAERAVIDDAEFLRCFGIEKKARCTAGEVWAHLLREAVPSHREFDAPLRALRRHGPLARRLVAFAGDRPSRKRLREMGARLCECLAEGRMFLPEKE